MTNQPFPEGKQTSSRGAIQKLPLWRRRSILLGGAVVIALASVTVVVVVNSGGREVTDGRAALAVQDIKGAGEVLVDGQGQTLYLFEPDEASAVTCTGGCASKWPPLNTTGSVSTFINAGVDGSKVKSVADQDGSRVVTFGGWPLYRYTSDEVGEVSGSGKDQNGGTWWALHPDGTRVKK